MHMVCQMVLLCIIAVLCIVGGHAQQGTVRLFAPDHPDHNLPDGHGGFELGVPAAGIVRDVLVGGRPQLNIEAPSPAVSGWRLYFDQWFHTVDGVANETAVHASGADNNTVGLRINAGNDTEAERCMVTAELHWRLRYEIGCSVSIGQTDGDAWLFVDGRLHVDAGGVYASSHLVPPVPLSQMGLDPGGVYAVDAFFAQRHAATRRADGTVVFALATTCPVLAPEPAQLHGARAPPAPPSGCRNGTAQCANGAACVHLHTVGGGYTDGSTCACPPGWCGPTCEQRSCQMHGADDAESGCQCARGWAGPRCGACADGANVSMLDGRLALARLHAAHGQTSDADGSEWSGHVHGRLRPPENRLDAAQLQRDTRHACAPVPSHGGSAIDYVLTPMPAAVLDLYLRGYFALAASVPDDWLQTRRAAHGRVGLLYTLAADERLPRGPVLPGTLSRFDGVYYDCQCEAHALGPATVDHGEPGGMLVGVDLRAAGPAPARRLDVGPWRFDEWPSAALAERTACTDARELAERYARELDTHAAHVARLAVRAEIDSPRQPVGAGTIVGVAFVLVATVGGVAWCYLAGVWTVDAQHPFNAALANGARRARLLALRIGEVLLDRDLDFGDDDDDDGRGPAGLPAGGNGRA
jgi:fibro-slime domain-containing protein